MTVCIAMTFNDGEGVIVASDRMTTSSRPPIEFEHKKKKIRKINETSVVLSAGDALVPKEIIGDAKKDLSKQTSPTVRQVTNIIKENFVLKRRKIAEEIFLKPRGLTLDDFYNSCVRFWPIGLVQTIDRAIQEEEIGIRLIVAGIDNISAHIYGVFDPGISVCYDDIGFTTIGIGEIHAISAIIPQYDPKISEKSALELICKAKKYSEIAPGVGKKTDITLLKDGIYKELTEEEIDKLNK